MSSLQNGLFAPGGAFADRLFTDYDEIARKVACLRAESKTIVLTMGSFDLFHVGHARYLMEGSNLADVLIVGVDDDAKTRQRKGEYRPVVPEGERLEMLLHTGYVKIVFLKSKGDEKWRLVKTIRPDFLLLSKATGRPEDEEEALRKFCGEVVVLKPQATTSTSAKIRRLHVSSIAGVRREMDGLFEKLLEEENG